MVYNQAGTQIHVDKTGPGHHHPVEMQNRLLVQVIRQ